MNRAKIVVSWRFVAFQTAPASPQMEKDFLTVAASLAVLCDHPASSEIIRIAHQNGCPQREVIGFQSFPGEGFGGAVRLPGEANSRAVLIGTRSFVEKASLELPSLLEIPFRKWGEEGATILLGGWDGYVRGIMKFDAETETPNEDY